MNTNITERCVEVLKTGDFTADEIAAKTGDSILAVRPSICTLNKEGVIRKTGERRMNTTGKTANVWTLKNVSVSLKPEVSPEVLAFVTHARNIGFSRDDIKSLASQYSAEELDKALERVFVG